MPERAFLGERLRQARERQGLSQAELARRIGTGVNQIPRYENGQAEPSPMQLKRLARHLEITSDYLLGLADQPNHSLSTPDLTPHERQLLDALRQGELRSFLRLLDQVLPADLPRAPR
jgi:transcriptional regulator with XRE-family HTH domain